MIYQVKDWSIFENHKSRILTTLKYVCVPNKHDGFSFNKIFTEADGAAIFGIWVVLVQICSKQKNRDGWLTRDGLSSGEPLTAEDIALKFRRQQSEVTRAFSVLSSPSIGWLVAHEHPIAPDSAAQTPDNTASKRIGSDRIGEEGIGEDGNSSTPVSGKPDVGALENNEQLVGGIQNTNELVMEGNAEPTTWADEAKLKEEQQKPKSRYECSKTLKLAEGILQHLNKKADRDYRMVESNLIPIAIRLEEVELDYKGVCEMIDRQCDLWRTDKRMSQYLRVATLFETAKFHDYYAARNLPVGAQPPNYEEDKF